MRREKLIDYDQVLYFAYELQQRIPEISNTIGEIIRLLCIDEMQDTQDLQYAILASIVKYSNTTPILLCVGDADQAIYESLGGVAKNIEEIAEEFGLDKLTRFELTGNYRSTQRLIDYFCLFRSTNSTINSRTSYVNEQGAITFHNQCIDQKEIPSFIAKLIKYALKEGIQQNEICVLAPHWWHVRALGRSLVQLLPNVDFEAPGLSPLYAQRDSIWFKIARLFLTTPSPSYFRTRHRWAKEVINDLDKNYGIVIPAAYRQARTFLRLINSIHSQVIDGLEFLQHVFQSLICKLAIDIHSHKTFYEDYSKFFKEADNLIEKSEGRVPRDVESLKKLFKHPSGVVVNTCHGIKGEEYDTVICFGLLQGYIPNWQDIYNRDGEKAIDRASKLLYVICSRAKRRLHLIAECGRTTRKGNQYKTTQVLQSIQYDYDENIL